MKNKKLIIIIAVIVIALLSACGIFIYANSPVSKIGSTIEFNIKSGENKIEIISDLKSSGLIRSKLAGLAYVFFSPGINLQAGKYIIYRDNSMIDIIKQIASGNTGQKAKTVKITFVEGKRFKDYAKQISNIFNISYDDIIKKCADKTYLQSLINNYWFLDESILNEEVYYPLEGFVFADTYNFYENATIEDIITKMLNNTENRLSDLKKKILSSNYSPSDIFTMASIIEMEAVTDEDRKKVSSVIYNRLDINMVLGMDTTTYYAVMKEMTDTLYAVDLDSKNGYNTRNASFFGLPVGPICSPSLSSINAAVNPDSTKYLYFYAVNGKDNFFETAEDFYEFQRNLD